MAGQADQLVGRVEDLAAQVAHRERLSGAAALLDRPAQHGVLERGQVAAEHPGDELGGEGLAGDDRVVAVAAGGVHRVDP